MSTSAWPKERVPADDESVYTDDTDPWEPDLDEAFAEYGCIDQFVHLVDPEHVAPSSPETSCIDRRDEAGDDECTTSAANGLDADMAALKMAMFARRSGRMLSRKSVGTGRLSGKLSGRVSRKLSTAPKQSLSRKQSTVNAVDTPAGADCDAKVVSGITSMQTGSSSDAMLSSSTSSNMGRVSMGRTTGSKKDAPLLKRMKTVLQHAKDLVRSATSLAKHD